MSDKAYCSGKEIATTTTRMMMLLKRVKLHRHLGVQTPLRWRTIPRTTRNLTRSFSSQSGTGASSDEARKVLMGLSLGISAFALIGGWVRVDLETQRQIDKLGDEAIDEAIKRDLQRVQQLQQLQEASSSEQNQQQEEENKVVVSRQSESLSRQEVDEPVDNCEDGQEQSKSLIQQEVDESVNSDEEREQWYMVKTLENPSPELEKALRRKDVQDIEPSQFDEVVRKSESPVILEVYQQGCPACRALMYRMRSLAQLAQEHMPKLKVVSIDGEKDDIPSEIADNAFPRLRIMVPNEQGKPDYQEIPMLDRRLAEEEYYRGLPTVKTLLRQLESATLGQSDFQQTPTIQQKAQQLEEKCKNLDCVNDFFNFAAAFQLSTVLKLEQSGLLTKANTRAANDLKTKIQFAQTILTEYNPDTPNDLILSAVKDVGDSVVSTAETLPDTVTSDIISQFVILSFFAERMAEYLDSEIRETMKLRIAQAMASALQKSEEHEQAHKEHDESQKEHEESQEELREEIAAILDEAKMVMGDIDQ